MSATPTSFDVIAIGGGAAGLMCAIEAGKRGRRVLVIERNQQVGRKILISGGGRCNFTNLYASPDQYISANPDFCRSALARYTSADFIALVEAHGIAYHEKKLGQLFCDGNARQVVDLLLRECRDAGVAIETGCEVWQVHKNSSFELETSAGDLACDSLVVASGGLSIPKIGATDLGMRLARQFGLAVTETQPGLVPFTFETDDQAFCAALSGISFDARVRCNGQSFRENVLFTHRGLSGPAILQSSSYWRPGDAIRIDLLPDDEALPLLQDTVSRGWGLARMLEARHPRRFALAWAQRYGPGDVLRSLPGAELEHVARKLHDWRLVPSGTEGFEKAEVTVGGIDTRELSSQTMESKRVPRLYFIGECVDVTGWLGGYNFQWAWASGFAAGQAV